MTVKRLEEIAAWAEEERAAYESDGAELRAAKFADLARCAKFVAWIEKELQTRPGTSIDFVLGRKGVNCMTFYDRSVGQTAVEAVENINIIED